MEATDSKLKASVVICAHNPRTVYLSAVLAALESQTLKKNEWELIIIDNASSDRLDRHVDISWHPYGRIFREEELGLTAARLRGISEARGEVLVFVDDDNVLNESYLSEAIKISDECPHLGAWGASVRARFQSEPPSWTEPYWRLLGVREIRESVWAKAIEYAPAQPCGAGLCVRRSVANAYANQVQMDPLRKSLDRRGTELLSGGDTDLAFTSLDLELGIGNFPALKLQHLIPPQRTEEKYLLSLRTGITASWLILMKTRGIELPVRPWWRVPFGWLRVTLRHGRRAGRFYLAEYRGYLLARAKIASRAL